MSKFVNPFEVVDRHTEWSAAATFTEWANQIVKEEGLPFGPARVEKRGVDKKRPDCVLYDDPSCTKTALVIEFKQPYYDPFDAELKEAARQKAAKRKSPYFATSNFKTLILWNTARVNNNEPEENQIRGRFELSRIENLDYLENPSYQLTIQTELKKFLNEFYQFYTGKKKENKLPLDEILIYRLSEKIKTLTILYTPIIQEQYQGDKQFRRSLRKWFNEQMWSLPPFPEIYDFEKAARQTAYLLVNKIFFYEILRAQTGQIPELRIPNDLSTGGQLKSELQAKFAHVLRIDYETIYSTDFIGDLAFPDSKGVIQTVTDLITALNRYDWPQLVKEAPDTIGKIFENLIPAKERHNLGQYFTRTDVVDLILSFCLKNPTTDTVMDPSCGTGTFLVQAYFQKRLLDPTLDHKEVLSSLWGVDIAKFPAHLSTINLALRDLREKDNYPQIFQNDFFALKLGGLVDHPGIDAKKVNRHDGTIQKIHYPRTVDVIVGNPPYTRSEEIRKISEKEETYKENLIQAALKDAKGRQIAKISKRAGIHAYFFIHGFKFLKNGGRFGFIVSNSWMDADYGKDLQEFFLKNYKVVAIIESKIERWFEDADINTCIIILEKAEGQANAASRDTNLVRFVQLKKPLTEFIPVFLTNKADQKERLSRIEKLKELVLVHDKYFEDEKIKIYPKLQKELWEEGSDLETDEYVGTKWGKYLRAPEIFFKIMEKGKDKIVPLKKLARIETYLNTGGADGFFIVKKISHKKGIVTIQNISREGAKKTFEIEQDYVTNFIKSPRELSKIWVEKKDSKWLLLLPSADKESLNKTLVARYIKWGESKGFNVRSGCQKRNPWWNLPKQARTPGMILWSRIHDDTHVAYYNPSRIANTNFYFVWPKGIDGKVLTAVLNSTFFALVKEFSGRVNFGLGTLKTEGIDLAKFSAIDAAFLTPYRKEILKVFNSIAHREINNIFEEIGAHSPEEISLDKIKPDRRELDKIILGDILGLTEEEQLEVYKGVVDLVSSRIQKAKSVNGKKKSKEKIIVEKQVEQILNQIGESNLSVVWQKYNPANNPKVKSVTVPQYDEKAHLLKSLFGWQVICGKQKFDCKSKDEAELLLHWILMGREEIALTSGIPSLSQDLTLVKKEYGRIHKILDDALDGIMDEKMKSRIRSLAWENLLTEADEST